jgi:hypothetical protein
LGRGPLEWDGVHLHPGHRGERRQGEVPVGSGAVVAERDRARLATQFSEHVGQAVELAVGAGDQHRRVVDETGDEPEVLDLVLRLLDHRHIQERRNVHNADGVAVGLCLGQVGIGDLARSSRLVDDDELSLASQAFLQERGELPGQQIGAAAGRKTDHDLDRAIVGPGSPGGWDRSQRECHGREGHTGKPHLCLLLDVEKQDPMVLPVSKSHKRLIRWPRHSFFDNEPGGQSAAAPKLAEDATMPRIASTKSRLSSLREKK